MGGYCGASKSLTQHFLRQKIPFSVIFGPFFWRFCDIFYAGFGLKSELGIRRTAVTLH